MPISDLDEIMACSFFEVFFLHCYLFKLRSIKHTSCTIQGALPTTDKVKIQEGGGGIYDIFKLTHVTHTLYYIQLTSILDGKVQ